MLTTSHQDTQAKGTPTRYTDDNVRMDWYAELYIAVKKLVNYSGTCHLWDHNYWLHYTGGH